LLWLCLQLPRLALEVFDRASVAGQPFAVVEGKRLVHANEAARREGLRAGMTATQARALSAQFILRARDEAAERRALEHCVGWAQSLSPAVSLEPPSALLLEIGGSVRYFAGLDALCKRAAHGLGELGYGYRLGVAPTPTAALWLARAGVSQPVVEQRNLQASPAPDP